MKLTARRSVDRSKEQVIKQIIFYVLRDKQLVFLSAFTVLNSSGGEERGGIHNYRGLGADGAYTTPLLNDPLSYIHNCWLQHTF